MKPTLTLLMGALAAGAFAAESKFEGSINFSANYAVSNRDSQALFLFGDASRKMGNGDLGIKAFYSFARQNQTNGGPFSTTEDRMSLAGRYDYLIGTRTIGYGSLRFDRDRIAALDLRTLAGAGLGSYIIPVSKLEDRGERDWKLSAGLSYLNEDYTGGGSDSYVGLELGSAYRMMLSDTLRLSHSAGFVPNFGDWSDYFFVSDLSLTMPLGDEKKASWQVSFSFLFDYDSTPAVGARQDNYKYVLGIGYKF